MITRLATANLHGGLRFDKTQAAAIEELPIPQRLKIALQQHQGSPARPSVSVGDKVFKGQALTAGETLSQVPVHASSSGIVESASENHITIITDGMDTPLPTHAPTPQTPCTQKELIQRLHDHGIVGMGGACFPSAKKIDSLTGRTTTLLINAAECDPVIHCDDALMCSSAKEICQGIRIIANALDVDSIIVGIEDNKPEAHQAISCALSLQKINATLVTVPAIYPSGAEKQLLQLCTREKTTTDTLTEAGIISFNVATCQAIFQSIHHNEPLISRITTLLDTSGQHRNFRVRIGTPITDLIAHAHGIEVSNSLEQYTIKSGGQMMPTFVRIDAAITKSSNCLSITKKTTPAQSRACIRCGACADVCPELLMPQHLHTHARHFHADSLHKLGLDQCIECGCCDSVCPSLLPLTEQFQQAKQQISELANAATLAEEAKQRFDKRQKRLQNQKELSTRRSPKKPKPQDTSKEILAGDDQQQKRKQLIEAALQRRRNKPRNNKTVHEKTAVSPPLQAGANTGPDIGDRADNTGDGSTGREL